MKNILKKIALLIAISSLTSIAQAGVTVYVPVGSANQVLVIDGDRDQVVGSIGDVTNVHGLASSPTSHYLVAGSMSLAPQNQAIPEGMSEDEHAAHHTGNKAQGNAPAAGASFISIIDTNTGQLVRRIDVDGISHHSVVTPDGRYAISTHTTTGNVSIIDIENQSLLRTVATGPVPNYVLVSSDGKYAYVSNSGNNTVSEIEIGNWTVRRNFKVGTTPEHMVFSADGKTLYVIDVGDNSVAAVSLAGGTVTRTFKVGEGPHGIDISDDGQNLYVSNKQGNGLTVIDIESGNSSETAMAPAPYHIKSITGTGKLYVSSRAEPWIWVVDQNSLEVIRKIPIIGQGHQMAIVHN